MNPQQGKVFEGMSKVLLPTSYGRKEINELNWHSQSGRPNHTAVLLPI